MDLIVDNKLVDSGSYSRNVSNLFVSSNYMNKNSNNINRNKCSNFMQYNNRYINWFKSNENKYMPYADTDTSSDVDYNKNNYIWLILPYI